MPFWSATSITATDSMSSCSIRRRGGRSPRCHQPGCLTGNWGSMEPHMHFVRCVLSDRLVHVSLYDVARQRIIHSAVFRLLLDSLVVGARMDVHRIADAVVRWVTGARGIAATRIAFVRDNRIHLIDSDGVNDTTLTTRGVALSPVWHPYGTALVYTRSRRCRDADRAARPPKWQDPHILADSTTDSTSHLYLRREGDSIIYATASKDGSQLAIVSATGKRTRAADSCGMRAPTCATLAEPTCSPDGRRVAFVASWPDVSAGIYHEDEWNRVAPFDSIHTRFTERTHRPRLVAERYSHRVSAAKPQIPGVGRAIAR